MKRFILAAAVVGAVAAGQVQADVLRLKDGTAIEGDVKRSDGGWVVTLADGGTVTVAGESVKVIEAGATGASGPMAGLASLRRSTEHGTEVGPIIERFERFVGQFPGTPAAEEAKKDLAVWRERRERDLVRVGKAWVTRGERERVQQAALELATQARQMIKEGKWKEAGELVDQSLETDPQGATALYLRALIEYQAGQFVAARKDLEAVKGVAPNHGPTLNNLGVITARQNRFGEAMSYFEQAMKASPVDRTIVDNTAEALHALAEDPQQRVQRALAQRVTATFDEQEPKLQARMKEQGMNRWGATWVNDQELERLNEAQRQINEKVAAIQAEFDATQQLIAGIDQRIAGNEATLRQLESNSYRQDLYTGRILVVPLPPVYDEIQRDIALQRAARQQALGKIDGLRAQARSVERQLPVPKYTGTLQVVGADGAPVVLAPPAEEVAATRPGG
jgi:Tfp pilus assembly protein PilF